VNILQELKTGTTTVGIVFRDGVVLAADAKASLGHLAYHEETKKVYKITDNLGMTMAGSVGDAQMIVRFLKSKARLFEIERENKMTPTAAATFLSNVMNSNRYYPFIAQFLLGGVNRVPELYDIDPSGGMLGRKDYSVTGSGTELALSVLDQNFAPGMEETEAVKLAVKAVDEAKRRDNYTGGFIISLMVITAKGVKESRVEDAKKFLK
jgi:proteasome beta subunit